MSDRSHFHFRDAALGDAEQRIRSIERKLDSSNAQYISEREAWQRSLETVEDSWRCEFSDAYYICQFFYIIIFIERLKYVHLY